MSETDPVPTLTAQQIAVAQTKLRAALGLPPEQFPLPAFIGMVSDEIEQLRAKGLNDTAIAELIHSTGIEGVSAEDVGLFYALPAERGRPAS